MNSRLLTSPKVVRLAAAILALRLLWVWAAAPRPAGQAESYAYPSIQSMKRDPLLEAIRLADKGSPMEGEQALRALISQKENPGARNALAVLYLRNRKPELALAELDVAIASDPRFTDAYFNRGSARVLLGDRKGALADYLKVVELQPKAPGQLQIAEKEVQRLTKEQGETAR